VSTRGRGLPWSALGLAGALHALSACSSGHGTERVFDGHTVRGRYIQPEAYAAYTEGVYREANGDFAGAEQAYRQAQVRDAQSPEILTRLGALACRQSVPRALRLFERANAFEPYAPAWTARARCLAGQQSAAALEAALHSVQLAPNSPEVNLLVARLYRENAQPELARAWLFAWLLLEPELGAGASELQSELALLGDAQLSLLASEALQGRAEQTDGARAPAGRSQPPPALIAAIRAKETEHARQLATEAHITPLELSLLASANAQPELGLAQAELLLDANPRDSGALIAGLVATAQLRDDEPLRRILHKAQADQTPAPELARALGEVLRARIDDEAARSWTQAYRRLLEASGERKR
jgi:hypothetical protein